jgi:hypothetical protein
MLFLWFYVSNQTGIDLQAAFDKKMDYKSVRDKSSQNEKLK